MIFIHDIVKIDAEITTQNNSLKFILGTYYKKQSFIALEQTSQQF